MNEAISEMDETELPNEAAERTESDGATERNDTETVAEADEPKADDTADEPKTDENEADEYAGEPYSDDDTKPYNAELVECCKTWQDGGFVKAFRILNDDRQCFEQKLSFKCKRNNKDDGVIRTYTLSVDGKRPQPMSLATIREKLEDYFLLLCDAWYDYKVSKDYDYDNDSMLFSEEWDWLDVGLQFVHCDNIEEFMD